MCPACLANTVGLLVGALSSAGVATAYLFKKNRLPDELATSSRQVPGLRLAAVTNLAAGARPGAPRGRVAPARPRDEST
jgi:hypothetical protein